MTTTITSDSPTRCEITLVTADGIEKTIIHPKLRRINDAIFRQMIAVNADHGIKVLRYNNIEVPPAADDVTVADADDLNNWLAGALTSSGATGAVCAVDIHAPRGATAACLLLDAGFKCVCRDGARPSCKVYERA